MARPPKLASMSVGVFHRHAYAFDVLYREGEKGSAKLLSIGPHDRLIGRPGRCTGLIRLLEHMHRFKGVWFCRGIDIAQHWLKNFPAKAA